MLLSPWDKGVKKDQRITEGKIKGPKIEDEALNAYDKKGRRNQFLSITIPWAFLITPQDCLFLSQVFLTMPFSFLRIPSVVGHGGIGAETPSAPGPNPVERVGPPGENQRACSPVTPQESSGNPEES